SPERARRELFRAEPGAGGNPLGSGHGPAGKLAVGGEKAKAGGKRERCPELNPGRQHATGATPEPEAHAATDARLQNTAPSSDAKLNLPALGELRSDADGHLIGIGGMGKSDFDPGLGRETIQHFANNDGWFDDMSDGPVDAELTIDGAKQHVASAWVVV